jgi:uncharacterized protein YkwD
MNRVAGLRSRRALWYLVPLAVLTVIGLVFGRSLLGSTSEAAQASGSGKVTSTGVSTTVPTPAPTAVVPAAVVTPIANLGVKQGIMTVTGPVEATQGAVVVFVLDGPRRMLRTDAQAPFALTVNTAKLPNGKYTLTTLLLRTGTNSVATTSNLRIKNAKSKAAKKKSAKKATAATDPTAGQPSGQPSGNGGNGGTAGGSGATTPAAGSGFAAEVLQLANVERAKAGCGPLALNGQLNNAAQGHSADMATANYFSHDSQDGRTPFDRIKAAGYAFSTAAENIAAGGTTAAGAMDQWMNSPGHKANILNCAFVDLGVGYAKGEKADYAGYWTQNFGKPL